MNYEIGEAQFFLVDVADFIEETTVMKNYVNMPVESKAKYVERVVLTITKQTSPRKNYGITRDVLRSFVVDVLADMEKRYQESGRFLFE
jgi:hypothetical protein